MNTIYVIFWRFEHKRKAGEFSEWMLVDEMPLTSKVEADHRLAALRYGSKSSNCCEYKAVEYVIEYKAVEYVIKGGEAA